MEIKQRGLKELRTIQIFLPACQEERRIHTTREKKIKGIENKVGSSEEWFPREGNDRDTMVLSKKGGGRGRKSHMVGGKSTFGPFGGGSRKPRTVKRSVPARCGT